MGHPKQYKPAPAQIEGTAEFGRQFLTTQDMMMMGY